MIEVERKYRVQDLTAIVMELQRLGYEQQETVQQEDTIYLINSKDFGEGFKKFDPVMRIRTVNGAHKMTYKRSINDDGDTVEHEITVTPIDPAKSMLLELGYHIVTNVNKKRTEFTKANVTVSVDEVARLGSFVEVEVLCNEGEEEHALKQVQEAASELGLKEEDIERKKYDHLMTELVS